MRFTQAAFITSYSLEQESVVSIVHGEVHGPGQAGSRIVHLQALDLIQRGQVVGKADLFHDYAILQ